jgi:hypothetical protein
MGSLFLDGRYWDSQYSIKIMKLGVYYSDGENEF